MLVVESITKEVMKEVEDAKEEACSTLLMCIVTTLNHGLRSGGGIGDILRPPSTQVRMASRKDCYPRSSAKGFIFLNYIQYF